MTLSLDQLADQGEAALRDLEAAEVAKLVRAEAERRESYQALRLAVSRIHPALGERLGELPPADFPATSSAGPYMLKLRPFGLAVIRLSFLSAEAEPGSSTGPVAWDLSIRGEGCYFLVPTDYGLESDPDLIDEDDERTWVRRRSVEARTNDLSVALALCRRADASYRAALTEARGLRGAE